MEQIMQEDQVITFSVFLICLGLKRELSGEDRQNKREVSGMRLDDDESKVLIVAKVNEKEKKLFKEDARKHNMSLSEWIKAALMSVHLEPVGLIEGDEDDSFNEKNNSREEDFLDMKEFADMLHVTPATARKYCLSGFVEFTKPGKKLYITRKEAQRFMQENSSESKVNSLGAKLFTVSEAAKFFNCSRSTVHRWINNGDLDYVKVGCQIRVRDVDIQNKLIKDKEI
jgi:excisionase family DNA binding protein